MADTDTPKQLFGSKRKRNCRFGVYPELGSTEATAGLCRDLVHFLHDHKKGDAANATFMAVFATPARLSVEEFQAKVNEQITLLHKAAEPYYCLPESEKEKQQDERDTLSFGGKVLKVVSIYRNTPGGQLKFDYPMLAFNLQEEKKETIGSDRPQKNQAA